MNAPDPVKSVSAIGRDAIEQIRQMWEAVCNQHRELGQDVDLLCGSIENATQDAAAAISSFKNLMTSVGQSIDLLHPTLELRLPAPPPEPGAPPKFLTERMPPPPERASIVNALSDSLNGRKRERRPPPKEDEDAVSEGVPGASY